MMQAKKGAMTRKTKSVAKGSPHVSPESPEQPETKSLGGNRRSFDAFLLLDENLNCVSISTSGRRLFDFPEDDYVGKNILEISPGIKDSGRYESYVEVMRTGEPFTAEDMVTDSELGELRFGVRAFKAGAGLGLVLTDITGRRQAEDKLKESRVKESYLESLIENALEGIVVLNADGTFRYESPSMERLLGRSPEDRVGKNSFEFVHPDDMVEAGEAFAGLIRDPGSTIHAEVRGLHKDGSWRILDVVGRNLVGDPKVRGIVANFRDITERKLAEEALRDSEEKFRRLVEDMNDGYCVIQGSKVVFANARVARMFGYGTQEVLGKTVEEALPPGIVAELSKMRARRQRGDVIGQYDVTLVGKDGQERQVELGTRVTQYEGKPALSVAVRDITERKEAEKALRESEHHYAALVGGLADGVFKLKEGKITWCNDRVEEIYARSKAEFIGKKASFFYPSHIGQKEYVRAVSTSIRERGVFCGTHTVQRKDGGTVYLEYSVSMIPGSDPVELVVVVRDVTERKLVEEALRESEEQYAALVGNLADAVFRFRDGAITWGNDRMKEMLGYSGDEMIGEDVSLFVPGETGLSEVYREVDAVLKEKGHFHGSTQVRKKDGSIAEIEYTASQIPGRDPVELVGVARDVTERSRMERALLRSEQNYRLLFESRLDGVFVVDEETRKVVLANQVAASMYGFGSADQVVDLDPLELIHPDDRERALKSIVDDMFGDDLRRIEEFRSVTRDGREIWISTIGTRMEYEGRPAGLISIRDISERKRAEEERQSLEQQLQLSGRLAAVGELAAGVAHELNNPLAAVQAYAQFITANKDLDETLRADVETIYKEAQRATRITANLLSFARRHKAEKSPVSINAVIENSLELHAYRLKVNNIGVRLELDAGLPNTMADFHQMRQAFVNIITNAEHAMTETRGEGKLVVKTERAGCMIRASFSDDGPGISDEDLKRIFDPFYTSKEVGKGTGLGLSICFGIVQEHDGHLYARSKRGKGATFVVEIPIVSENDLTGGDGNSIESQGVHHG
jgi:two-component system NtrC family sensor kinase